MATSTPAAFLRMTADDSVHESRRGNSKEPTCRDILRDICRELGAEGGAEAGMESWAVTLPRWRRVPVATGALLVVGLDGSSRGPAAVGGANGVSIAGF